MLQQEFGGFDKANNGMKIVESVDKVKEFKTCDIYYTKPKSTLCHFFMELTISLLDLAEVHISYSGIILNKLNQNLNIFNR